MRNEGAAPGLRERKKQATRAALAEAAVRLAAEHGAENVTVEAISEAAGVSPRTFFNYFDSHDDAFVMIDRGIGERVRRAVREAPASVTALDAVREALATELADVVEEQREIWDLRAAVLQRSPHLLVRGMGAHMTEELELAEAIAERLGAPAFRTAEGERVSRRPGPCAHVPDTSALGLYPRLLAAVGTTAVRVAVEHWCAQGPEATFPDIFRRAFALLAAGLPEPPADG
ncbi:TetR family transcriptional regulator [Streptomyces sp. 35G-GA-8]|uniref:TetR family transcriptional regulator n=1 Tax=Streptomyces sp. 35G-GA-8 TaxID=2939434 RepID=UPI00201F422B|nr:TetR family transcriptional regulator [Streptomyces sp. 35G-GA-8]MCL7378444.1 TetR family transcriptional regulator [Streptomyces sp. 35G-GA-8]